MTGDFQAFFEEVRLAAKKHGIQAHVVTAVASDGPGSQVKVSSNGNHTFDNEKDAVIIKRCVSAMEESIAQVLPRLGGEHEQQPKFLS